MTDDLYQAIWEKCANLSPEEFVRIIANLWRRVKEDESYRVENSDIISGMSEEYKKLEIAYDAILQENEQLKETILHTSQVNQVYTNEIFGRGTEKMADILDGTPAQEEIDESEKDGSDSEEQGPAPSGPNRAQRRALEHGKHGNGGRKHRKGFKKGDFSALPQERYFKLDKEALDQKYGVGGWRIAFWHDHIVVEEVPAYVRVRHIYTPVISHGLEHLMETVPYDAPLCQRSFASPSIVARIMYQKYAMALPLYRQERFFRDFGVNLSRQLMCSWILRFSQELFAPIYEYLEEKLLAVPYHQCDETTMQVINDGRDAGSTSYFWLHTTGELAEVPAIFLYCYELTRGTDHLREFYQDFQGFITCDAYCAYQTLEKERADAIVLCGCMMHMRRRFATALLLASPSELSEEQIEALPEAKALKYIGAIYNADEPLKDLPFGERQQQRQEVVKPLVEDFYNYIGSLDTGDPLMGERMKDAIQYAMNQKDYLTRFLTDGRVPIDNGFCERSIRGLCLIRNSSLFCDSISGAEATAIMCSVVQTARANGANVYWYLRYILETMPNFPEEGDLETMMPWSEEYQKYERPRVAHEPLPQDPTLYSERPKTPRKRKREQIA